MQILLPTIYGVSLVAAMFLGAGSVIAAEPVQLDLWYRELAQKPKSKVIFSQRVVFVSEFEPTQTKLPAGDLAESMKDEFFEVLSERETNFSHLINDNPTSEGTIEIPEKGVENRIAAVFKETFADTVVYASPKQERWDIYRLDETGTITKEITAKAGASDMKAAKEWFIEKIGYSGVVLDYKEPYLLIGSIKNLQAGKSALLVAASSKQFRIKKSETQIATALKIIDCKKGLCVAELLIKSNIGDVFGWKIVL
jgi:hypothetical protein